MKDPRNGIWVAQKYRMNVTTNASMENNIERSDANETNISNTG